MRRRPVDIVDPGVLAGWPTKRLLGRLNALRVLEESPRVSDMTAEQAAVGAAILFKSDPHWSLAYRELKSILDQREHLPRGRAVRQARASQAGAASRSRRR